MQQKLTAAELIEILKTIPPETEIWALEEISSGYAVYASTMSITLNETLKDSDIPEPDKWTGLEYSPKLGKYPATLTFGLK